MMGRRSSRLLLCLLLSCAGSQAAFAQSLWPLAQGPSGLPQSQSGLPQNPSGLLQNPSGMRDVGTLWVNATSMADANDEQSGEAAGDAQHRGVQVSSALMARFSYRPLERERLKVQFIAQTGTRHYLALHEFTPTGHNAQLSAVVPLGRTSINVTESVTYTPNYSLVGNLTLIPDDTGAISSSWVDYSVARNPSVSSLTNVGLIWAISSRAGLGMSYGLRRTAFTDGTGADLTYSGAGARFGYRLTKFLNFRAGYARRLGSYGLTAGSPDDLTGSPVFLAGAPDIFVDDVDIGLDFNNNQSRAIKLGRKTTLAFGTGSSIVTEETRHRFMLTGSATLVRELGRKGSAALSYERGVQMIDGLRAPVFADSVRGSVTASLTSRVSLTNGITYTFGAVGLRSGNNDYRTVSGSSEVNVDVTRGTALYVGYIYAANTLGSSVELPIGVPNVYGRQSVRVGLSVRMPVIQRPPSRERK